MIKISITLMNKERILKYSISFCLAIAAFGAALAQATIRSQGNDLTLALILMGIGSGGALVSEVVRRKTTPRKVLEEEKKAQEEWLERGILFDFNITPFVFLSGMTAEFFSFSQLEYKIAAVVIYSLLSYSIYVNQRKRIPTFRWDYLFHFGLALAIPTCAFAWHHPEFLHEIGVSGISVSREFSFLTFLYLQVGLILSTIITASHAWRTTFLMKRSLSVKNLQTLQRDFLSGTRNETKKNILREIVSDLAISRESLIHGHFKITIAWGWSIIDRLLSQLSEKGEMKERAEELGLLTDEFRKSYSIRNKTVHAGYKPDFNDAFDCVQLIKTIMLSLMSRKSE